MGTPECRRGQGVIGGGRKVIGSSTTLSAGGCVYSRRRSARRPPSPPARSQVEEYEGPFKGSRGTSPRGATTARWTRRDHLREGTAVFLEASEFAFA